jgi:hypothetical protein
MSTQRDLLAVLDATVHLLALRFSNYFKIGELLPCALCDDLGPLPPQLKYIGWDVAPSSTVYVSGGLSEMLLLRYSARRARAVGSRKMFWDT